MDQDPSTGMSPFCAITNPRAEDEILFACSRQHLQPCHRERLSQITERASSNWHEIFATARNHGVAPLVFANLQKCADVAARIPADVSENFARCTRNNALVKALYDERARGILDFFERRSTHVMFIKGFALDATVYEQPWYTLSADIDLIMKCRREDFPQADRKAASELDAGRSPLERRISIEYGWFEHHDVSMDGLLPVDFEAIWDQAKEIRVQNRTAFVMCPEHLLLTACINSCRKRFFRLKALCDISEILLLLPIDWDRFVRTARQWRCAALAYAALSAVRVTLGCAVPQSLAEELRLSPLRRRMIGYLCRRLSFSSLAALGGDSRLPAKRLGASLLLRTASHDLSQLWTSLKITWRRNASSMETPSGESATD
jgi:hypothetical protein